MSGQTECGPSTQWSLNQPNKGGNSDSGYSTMNPEDTVLSELNLSQKPYDFTV